MTILLAGSILGAGFLLGLLRPSWFLWFYLVVTTQLFGFVPFTSWEIQGRVEFIVYLNLATAVAAAVRLLVYPRLRRIGGLLVLGFGWFFSLGLALPVLRGESTLFWALTDGQDFLGFSLLLYLLTTSLPDKEVQRPMTAVGVMLAIIVLVYAATGWNPPAYEPVDVTVGSEASIHFFTPVYLLFALVLLLRGWFDSGQDSPLALSLAAIVFLGVLVQGHKSVAIAALGLVAATVIRESPRRLVKAFSVLVLAVVLGSFLSPRATRDIISEVRDDLIQPHGAIASRIVYNRHRVGLIRDRPIVGYGFVDERSTLGERYFRFEDPRFMQGVGTIDAGYIDVGIRFGFLGGSLFILLWLFVPLCEVIRQNARAMTWTVAAFLLSYLIIAATWSVFTYLHGIVPGSVALYLLIGGRQWSQV